MNLQLRKPNVAFIHNLKWWRHGVSSRADIGDKKHEYRGERDSGVLRRTWTQRIGNGSPSRVTDGGVDSPAPLTRHSPYMTINFCHPVLGPQEPGRLSPLSNVSAYLESGFQIIYPGKKIHNNYRTLTMYISPRLNITETYLLSQAFALLQNFPLKTCSSL